LIQKGIFQLTPKKILVFDSKKLIQKENENIVMILLEK